MHILAFLTLTDLGALAFFLAGWVAYALAVGGRFFARVSLTQAMNLERAEWMRVMARRDLRMIDTSIMVGLQQGTAFFASTSIFAVGGCFALLGASDRVIGVLSDLPLAGVPARQVFEAKVIGLLMLLVYSFFKFAWSYRLFNYCSILIGSVPNRHDAKHDQPEMEQAIARAAAMNIVAAQNFNAGLRGIFFSMAYLGWFVGPAVLVLTTVLVLIVLLRRQFYSNARNMLVGDGR